MGGFQPSTQLESVADVGLLVAVNVRHTHTALEAWYRTVWAWG